MRSQRQIFRVLMVARIAGSAGRDLASGVFNYARDGKHWNIRIVAEPETFTRQSLRERRWGELDGVIAAELPDAGTIAELRQAGIPLVRIGLDPRFPKNSALAFSVHNDEEQIGVLAAEFLMSLGVFRSYVYFPVPSPLAPFHVWSARRGEAFCARLQTAGFTATDYSSVAELGSEEDLDGIAGFLAELPRPIAAFAAWDQRGDQVLKAAKAARIKVPSQLAVIGVDNDEFICDFAEPPLTSVRPDHVREGLRAAVALNAMMHSKSPRPALRDPVAPLGIVTRESASPISPAANLIRRATDFIERHACEGARPADVAQALGVSRRLLDMRFAAFVNHSVADEIRETRFRKLTHLLKTTARPIESIVHAAGFANRRSLEALFRSRYGMTMREWRR